MINHAEIIDLYLAKLKDRAKKLADEADKMSIYDNTSLRASERLHLEKRDLLNKAKTITECSVILLSLLEDQS